MPPSHLFGFIFNPPSEYHATKNFFYLFLGLDNPPAQL